MSFYKQIYRYGILTPAIIFNIIAITIALIFYRNYVDNQDNQFKELISNSLKEDLQERFTEASLKAEVLAESKSLYDLINAEVLDKASLEELATQFSRRFNSHIEIYRDNAPLIRIEEDTVPISSIGTVIKVFNSSPEKSRQYFMYDNDLLYFNSLRKVSSTHGTVTISVSTSLSSRDLDKYSKVLQTQIALHRKDTRRLGDFIPSHEGLNLFVGLSKNGEKINLTYNTTEHLWTVNESFDSFQRALIFTLLPFTFLALIFSFTFLKNKYNMHTKATVEKNTLLEKMSSPIYDSSNRQSEIFNITSVNHDKLSAILRGFDSHKNLLQKNTESINSFSKKVQGAYERLANVEREFDSVVRNLNNVLEQLQESASTASHVKSVASETTILSLNAALEASQAGEKGKGFATVAVNVKKLAAQTTSLAENIKEKIELALLSSQRCTTSTKNNVKEFKSIVSAIGSIQHEIKSLNSLFQSRARENAKNLESLEMYQEHAFHLMESAQKLETQNQQVMNQTIKSNPQKLAS